MYEYKIIIDRWVDGDTVDVDIDLGFGVWLRDERVRLYGIDTPESRTSDDIEKIYGFAAKEYLERYLSAGNIVLKTKTYDAKGKFGRILGELWAFDTNINERMVEENHAVRYEGQSKEDIKEAHLKNRAKLGLHTIQSFEE